MHFNPLRTYAEISRRKKPALYAVRRVYSARVLSFQSRVTIILGALYIGPTAACRDISSQMIRFFFEHLEIEFGSQPIKYLLRKAF